MILTRLLGGGEPDREADGEGSVGPPAERGHRHQARAGQQLVLVTPVHALHSTVQCITVQYFIVQYSTLLYSTVQYSTFLSMRYLNIKMFTCGVSTLWIMQVRFKKLFSPMKSSWSPWICVNDSEIMDNDTHLVLVSDIQLQLCYGSYLFQIFVVPLRNFICKKYLCRKAFCWSSSIYY